MNIKRNGLIFLAIILLVFSFMLWLAWEVTTAETSMLFDRHAMPWEYTSTVIGEPTQTEIPPWQYTSVVVIQPTWTAQPDTPPLPTAAPPKPTTQPYKPTITQTPKPTTGSSPDYYIP